MFSMPDIDLLISEVLLVFSLIVGLMIWGVSKKLLLGLVVFSILGNIIFFGKRRF